MEKASTFCLCHVLLSCLFLTPTFATGKSYIVYFGKHNHATPDGVDHENVRNKHCQFLGKFLGSDEKAKDAVFYSYTNYINGFAAHLNEEEAAEIAIHYVCDPYWKRLNYCLLEHPKVVSVLPNRAHHLHTTRSWEFLGLERDGKTVPNSIWEKANYGEDVIIGNLDTGVWPESKSFNDDGFGPVPARWKGVCQNSTDKNGVKCNRKLIGARYFDEGYVSAVGHHDQEGFVSPRDHEGHGTHTLSTAGGSFARNASVFGFATGTAKGGSPKARVAAYKVCWPSVGGEGGCFTADIMAAFDAAIADGVDVISGSLGGESTEYFQDGIAIGAFHAVSKGIAVVVSAGNSGPKSGSVENFAPWIFTIAASTLDRQFPANVSLGNNVTLTGQSISEDSLPNKLYPLAAGHDLAISNATSGRYCLVDSLDPVKTKGKIVACLRGINSRVEKGYAVLKAGGVGMILCNSDANGNQLVADAHMLPASLLTASDGQKVFIYINSTKSPVAYITKPTTELNVKPAPVMAAFSSQGPNLVTPQILKPDITAPGVSILAAYTGATSPAENANDPRRVKFNVMSGTSMSCPHVAGIVGLIKKAHPDWSSAAIKSALMTTANEIDNKKEPILNADHVNATPFSFGAGHVNPNQALDPDLVYDSGMEDYVKFFCANGYNSTMITTFTGKSETCPSKLPKIGDLNYPSIVFTNLVGSDSVSRTVKNVGTPGTYKVKIQKPSGVSITVKPEEMTFENVDEEQSFTVTAQAKKGAKNGHVFGRLTWSDGKHSVKSPIVISVGVEEN